MEIIKGKQLADMTTFRIGGKAKFFCSVKDKQDLKVAVDFAREKKLPIFILGGGSNILISDKGFDGLVIKIDIKGIKVESPESKVESQRGEASDTSFGELRGEPSGRELGLGNRGIVRRKNVSDAETYLRASAGENWDDFVGRTVSNGYGGLENLSLIPGTVGAAPVQNVGAYGVEVGDLIESVEVFDTEGSNFKILSKEECKFSYRNSIFKHEKGRCIITSVLFKLKKNTEPDISYKDLKDYFSQNDQVSMINEQGKVESMPVQSQGEAADTSFGGLLGEPSGRVRGMGNQGIARRKNVSVAESDSINNTLDSRSPEQANEPSHESADSPVDGFHGNDKVTSIYNSSITEVREAIISIRMSKLPNLNKFGTAGSLFKNPIISKEKYLELKEKYSELPNFPEVDGRVKVPLAWIIDKVCGLKGKKFGKAGVHETQALVIVNYGDANFEDIEKVASEVERVVKEKTGIEIEREVIMD
jgi:UDP-N-acetylenolpyruvoylglucosamine reductase